MTHRLPLSRVARMAGVSRAHIQELARSGALDSFDGTVTLSEVLRVFPDIVLENDSELRRLEAIKAAAAHKSPLHDELPDANVLAGRLEALGRDYARTKVGAGLHELAHAWLAGRLGDLADEGAIGQETAQALITGFRQQLAASPQDRARRERLIALESRMRVMSAQATLLPKGRQFPVEGRETFLEAGLRAGLDMPYGCSNGNCGDCRARLTHGEAARIRPHDFRLSEAEKAQGWILTCAYTAIGDVTLETAEPGIIPQQQITGKLRQAEPLGDSIIALHLVTSRSERLRFLAGQRVSAAIDGVSADFHVASCPCEERRIELHVRRGSGLFAERIEAGLKPNAEFVLNGPQGDFVLDEDSVRPVLLVAQGLGFAPVKSLLQHALALENAPEVLLIRLPGPCGAYQDNLLRSYASGLDNFRYVNAEQGELKDALAGLAPGGLAGFDAYVAGPAEGLADIGRALAGAGLPEGRLRAERLA